MINIGTLFLLLIGTVFSDGFLFPDQVYSNANSESRYSEGNDWSNLNSYGDIYTGHGYRQTFARHDRHRPKFNVHYDGNQGELTPGFKTHHSGNFRRGNQQNHFPHYGGIVSQSQANAQSSGFGSHADSQSGSQSFNGGSQANSEAQVQLQGYQSFPFGPSGGGTSALSGASAASATAGIVDGVATASAAAAAASASSAHGGSSSSSSSSFSTAGGNNGGFGNGQNPLWFFRARVADEDADVNLKKTNADSAASAGEEKLIFSQK